MVFVSLLLSRVVCECKMKGATLIFVVYTISCSAFMEVLIGKRCKIVKWSIESTVVKGGRESWFYSNLYCAQFFAYSRPLHWACFGWVVKFWDKRARNKPVLAQWCK
ncbi:hypothetical protein HanPI659440_Chr04g0144391 [Helianthus annuus]|nr:hypothetical protein HanPI659440_Chr04g0144391 [Helianthus annuus]